MRRLIILLVLFVFTSCIDNDIPYPVIKGNVIEFEVIGQVKTDINATKQTIDITLSDTVDMSKVKLRRIKFTAGAQCTLDTIALLDMTKTISFTLSTYQDYHWQIKAEQPIERLVRVANQIGEASIDALNKIVILYVPKNQDLAHIQVFQMKLGPSIASILPNPYQTTNFTRPQIFLVKYFNKVEEWKVYIFKEE